MKARQLGCRPIYTGSRSWTSLQWAKESCSITSRVSGLNFSFNLMLEAVCLLFWMKETRIFKCSFVDDANGLRWWKILNFSQDTSTCTLFSCDSPLKQLFYNFWSTFWINKDKKIMFSSFMDQAHNFDLFQTKKLKKFFIITLFNNVLKNLRSIGSRLMQPQGSV